MMTKTKTKLCSTKQTKPSHEFDLISEIHENYNTMTKAPMHLVYLGKMSLKMLGKMAFSLQALCAHKIMSRGSTTKMLAVKFCF